MTKKNLINILCVLTVIIALLVFSCETFAGSLTLKLVRDSLTNVDDAAGRWQYEGGKVYYNNRHIAYYAATRRVVWKGTDPQNTAMFTMTIFVLGEKPPSNITLQGSHDYSSGVYIGSVSAASIKNKPLIGANFSGKAGATGQLVISWPTADVFVLK